MNNAMVAELIKQCPRHYIAEFAQKILSGGQKPEYLDLFVGMTELSDCEFVDLSS